MEWKNHSCRITHTHVHVMMMMMEMYVCLWWEEGYDAVSVVTVVSWEVSLSQKTSLETGGN